MLPTCGFSREPWALVFQADHFTLNVSTVNLDKDPMSCLQPTCGI